MEYVVIRTGGKQYTVAKGDILEVERLGSKKDEVHSFDDVLLYVADGKVEIGNPKLTNIKVIAKVIDEIKAEKIRVSKFKSKVRTRRTTGHRQILSKVQIEGIEISGKSSKKDEEAKEKAKKSTKK